MDIKIGKIYKENAKYVFNIAVGMLRNRDDAEDVVQNVFIKLSENLHSFKGESDIKTYLYRMTINKCIDLIRSNKIREKHMDKAVKSPVPQTDTGFILWDLLSRLDINHSAPLLLSEIGGFTYNEISEILNINSGTVKSRINRAINKMKSFVEAQS